MNKTAKNRKKGKVRYFTFGSNFGRKTNEKRVASLKEAADKVLNLLTFNINRAALQLIKGATSLGWKYGKGYIHLRRGSR